MKVRQITFGEDEMPETVTVELAIREAAFIAKCVGGLNDPAANEILHDGATAVHQIYSGLTGLVFNAYWDGGLEDVR